MRTAAVVATLGGLAGVALAAAKPGEVKVMLANGAGQKAGMAIFKTTRKGVKVTLKFENLPIGVHGVHIHQNAVCAGPHFNPDGKQHGFDNPMGHHLGDIPGNVTVGEDHHGEASFELTGITLDAAGANSITLKGASVVVHEKADDMKTDPSGASGNRIACGVVPVAGQTVE